MNSPLRTLICTLIGGLLLTGANAQYSAQVYNLNRISNNSTLLLNDSTLTPSLGQNSSVGQVSASTGPNPTTSDGLTDVKSLYPTNGDSTLVLQRSGSGASCVVGVPRYNLGAEIVPPLVQADGRLPAGADYWRAMPVAPGERFVVDAKQGIGDGNGILTPLPTSSVSVTQSSIRSTQITVTTKPTAMVVGATVLGQPITAIQGTGPYSVTLAGYANETINSAQNVTIYPSMAYYYSPHAEKVYASQPGAVSVTWISAALNNVTGSFDCYTETFNVTASVAEGVTVHPLFWTDGVFDGPLVNVTDTRVSAVNPIYNATVPKAVAAEVEIPGYNPTVQNLTTLSYQKISGTSVLHAYNVEGRILVEYLGANRLPGGICDSLGIEVVELVRAPQVNRVATNLGQKIQPHDTSDPSLEPSPVMFGGGGKSYYGTVIKPDGKSDYYAELETSPANTPDNGLPADLNNAYNKVVFYWMKPGNFGSMWPQFQDRYWQRWSPNLYDYAFYTVGAGGSTPATGVAFTAASLPSLVTQDGPSHASSAIDAPTQRFYVTLTGDVTRNRSLLKFYGSPDKVWYMNIFTQAESLLTLAPTNSVTSTQNGVTTVTVGSTQGLFAGMTVSGGDINGANTIASIKDATHYILSPPKGLVPWLSNPSFENSPVVVPDKNGKYDGYSADRESIPGWYCFEDLFGLNNSTVNSFADNGGIPDGENVLFLQGDWNGASTTILGLVKGWQYRLTFKANKRNYLATVGRGEDLAVDINGASVMMKAVAGAYQTITVDFTATGSTASLAVRNRTAGDTTLLIDDFKVVSFNSILANGAHQWTYGAEPDGDVPINTSAMVGKRIEPPAGHEFAGLITGGTSYNPAAYIDPVKYGVAAANAGAIIPVNATPGDNVLTVRWYRKYSDPNNVYEDVYIPGKVGRYTVSYPTDATPIVIASGVGSGDLPPAEAAGSIYFNNKPGVGYNPNEEHGLILGGRAYALRDDLNIYSNGSTTQPASNYNAASYTSEPYLLVAYTDPDDHRPAMHAYKVLRTDATHSFDYSATAGTLLVKPYPLPLLPPPLEKGVCKDFQTEVTDLPVNTLVSADPEYANFTFKDRKGLVWVHRGMHDNIRSCTPSGTTISVSNVTGLSAGMHVRGTGIEEQAKIVTVGAGSITLDQTVPAGGARDWTFSPSFVMRCYYPSQPSFFVPGPGVTDEPVPGTLLPFLRDGARKGSYLDIKSTDKDLKDQPLGLTYYPEWPEIVPELVVGETLTLPKYGLPQVRGQKSAEVIYQQSIAKDASNGLNKSSVTLLDPTREKTVALTASLPSSIATTSYKGKTYFQNLPPDLKQRFYLDPLRGSKGTLVLVGQFHEETAGEMYLDLNQLTASQEVLVKGLVSSTDKDKTAWDNLIADLKTTVQTFVENDKVKGTFIAAVGLDLSIYAVGSNITKPAVTSAVAKRVRFPIHSFTPQLSWTAPAVAQPTAAPSMAVVGSADTAVDSYALTASGMGSGYVSMVFGNGKAFTQDGDPVSIQVFKVAPKLNIGDLKLIVSDNPLDEKVTLRHSGDFAGRPEDYEFEWRQCSPSNGKPEVYRSAVTTQIGATSQWKVVSAPGKKLPTVAQYAAVGPVSFPRSVGMNPYSEVIAELAPTEINEATGRVFLPQVDRLAVGMVVTGSGVSNFALVQSVDQVKKYITLDHGIPSNKLPLIFTKITYPQKDRDAGYPAVVAKPITGLDFTGGVPQSVFFSARLGATDGLVLYVNGVPAVAYQAPASFTSTNASSGLSPQGIMQTDLKQFAISPRYFINGVNTLEVALYSSADANTFSFIDFMLEASSETDRVDYVGSPWLHASGQSSGVYPWSSSVNIGAGIDGPFNGSTFIINDHWFTMRYRPKASVGSVVGTSWSRWMEPQFVEGWIKRVLAGINPFEQRIKDLYNNAVDTNVSMLTQAGKRWEGDVALNMDAVGTAGLIEIYETVLNRGKSMSIDANTNDPDTNQALVYASGYLNDLYTILGNEAYADAANPTISTGDSSSSSQINSSRFSFEGQVASSLDEELALLRGRDDSGSTGVSTAPYYNRLVWNYTHGINSGEAIYATNYNIKDNVKNGVIEEADAQQMFPQGHGDAYGHYLTALTGYYKLLANPNFTWTPAAETVTVSGQPVSVDFKDERKFAAAAGNWVRTAEQVVGLVYRQSYKDDPSWGWSQFRGDDWSMDEELSRSGQGSYLHWAMANALLPPVDRDHTGIQRIDRVTTPEINELAAAGNSLQTTADNASAHLNPLGLSPGSVAFDIDPQKGTSQFLQLYDRALSALNNAAGAFNQSCLMSQSLRNQNNSLDDYTDALSGQEDAYTSQLIEIFGRPYSGEVGAGKTYVQDYKGPDLVHWFVVDRPFANTPKVMVDSSISTATYSVMVKKERGVDDFTSESIADILKASTTKYDVVPVTIQPNQFIQYSDTYLSNMGTRPETGELQSVLLDARVAYLDLISNFKANDRLKSDFVRKGNLLKSQLEILRKQNVLNQNVRDDEAQTAAFDSYVEQYKEVDGVLMNFIDASMGAYIESIPTAVDDVLAPFRGAFALSRAIIMMSFESNIAVQSARQRREALRLLHANHWNQKQMDQLGLTQETQQLVYEFEQDYNQFVGQTEALEGPALCYQRANAAVLSVLGRANRLLAEREGFRMRAAAVIQGYRTKDLTFRVFRDESLEQYRSLFDLASRYTYLAAKAYDYETGLLGTTAGQTVFEKIVASRSLGDLTGGVPQSTVSTLGDAGLAGTMAQLSADFSVAEGRLGINNPDYYGTVFSLRKELYRIQDDPDITSDDDSWKQVLEQHVVSNIMNDVDVITQCRNIQKTANTAVPGFIIPFSSTIQHGKNFFGLDLAAFDHAYSATSFATKISNAGIVFPGYVGMDASMSAQEVTSANSGYALSASPYVYLIPCGNDSMRAPPLGDVDTIRTWTVQDQALPLPYNLGKVNFNSNQFFNANGTLSEQPWIIRKHQAFRAVGMSSLFETGEPPLEFSSSRLIARSAWNSKWKLVIPAYTLSSNESDAINRFVSSVTDIGLYLRTYSHSGN